MMSNPTTNSINPRKLFHSKWTAVEPSHREKHFLVTDVHLDESGVTQTCTLEAIYSGRERLLQWRELKDASRWRMGWI